MALITCPECGQKISDTARSCPNCGYPMHSNVTNASKEQHTTYETVSAQQPKQLLKKSLLLCLLLPVIEFGLLVVYAIIRPSDDFFDYGIVAFHQYAFLLNSILAIILAAKAICEILKARKEKTTAWKNIISLIMCVCFLLGNSGILWEGVREDLFFSGIFSVTSKGISGMWEDHSTTDDFVFIYQFSEDGKYTSSIQKDGITIPGGTGTYEIDGENLTVVMSNGQSISDEFSVKGDTLKWGSQTLTRRK